jgi:hypothetical protein
MLNRKIKATYLKNITFLIWVSSTVQKGFETFLLRNITAAQVCDATDD